MTADQPVAQRIPYPGLDPFSLAYRDLFFGRDVEGRVVSAMMATEPISVLTGASGTGKSSLIRAMVVPTLISRGWTVVYVHPATDPLHELRKEVLEQSIPDARAELASIHRAIAAGPNRRGQALTGQSRLSSVAAWYDGLSHGDERRASTLGDVEAKIPRITLFSQVLAGLIPAANAAICYATLHGTGNPEAADPTLDDIVACGDQLDMGKSRVLGNVAAEALEDLLGNLWRRWLSLIDRRGLIVILDQAEELYTSIGSSRTGLGVRASSNGSMAQGRRHAEWRDGLFESLPEFMLAAAHQPLRLCFGIRPEWYTDLRVSLGSSAPDESCAVHILQPMTKEQAGRAIVKPAQCVEGRIDNPVTNAVLEELEAEGMGSGIDPFLLGLMCRRLWDLASEDAGQSPTRVSLKHLDRLSRPPMSRLQTSGSDADLADETVPVVEGALLWLLLTFIDALDPMDRFDALEMLDSLFTAGGTRRVVGESELVERPLRSRTHLQKVLEGMESARVVRRIPRGGETLIEIRHDRLAEPLLELRQRIEASAQEPDEHGTRYRMNLTRSIEILLRFDGRRLAQSMSDGMKEDVLPGWARESLRANSDALIWPPAAARALLFSVLYAGPAKNDVDGTCYRNTLRVLMSRACTSNDIQDEVAATDYLDQLGTMISRGAQLSREEIDHLDQRLVPRLSIDERLLLLDAIVRQRSEGMVAADDLSRIRKWVRLCLG